MKALYITAVRINNVVFEPGDILPGVDGFISEDSNNTAKCIVTRDTCYKTDIQVGFVDDMLASGKCVSVPVSIDCKKLSSIDNDCSIVKNHTVQDIIDVQLKRESLRIHSHYANITGFETEIREVEFNIDKCIGIRITSFHYSQMEYKCKSDNKSYHTTEDLWIDKTVNIFIDGFKSPFIYSLDIELNPFDKDDKHYEPLYKLLHDEIVIEYENSGFKIYSTKNVVDGFKFENIIKEG